MSRPFIKAAAEVELPPVWIRFQSYARQSWREVKKRKCNFLLGSFSIFLVVVVAAVCTTILANAPIIFVQQSEVCCYLRATP